MNERRKLNHDIRNGLNTLVLNVQCLPISTGADLVECLDAIITAADFVSVQFDQLLALPDDAAATRPP